MLSDDITAKAGTNGDHGHEAGTGGRSWGLVQAQGPNTIITVEVAVRAGWWFFFWFVFSLKEQFCVIFGSSSHILLIMLFHCNLSIFLNTGRKRKRLRKSAERVAAGLPVHLPSGAETLQWMHKRPWLEGKTQSLQLHLSWVMLVFWDIGASLLRIPFLNYFCFKWHCLAAPDWANIWLLTKLGVTLSSKQKQIFHYLFSGWREPKSCRSRKKKKC